MARTQRLMIEMRDPCRFGVSSPPMRRVKGPAAALLMLALCGCATARPPRTRAGAAGPAAAARAHARACAHDDGNGCLELGLDREKGRGIPVDLPGAYTAYEKGCGKGYGLACTNR